MPKVQYIAQSGHTRQYKNNQKKDPYICNAIRLFLLEAVAGSRCSNEPERVFRHPVAAEMSLDKTFLTDGKRPFLN